METVYNVKGMTCQGCAKSLEESLILHDKINKVFVSLENGSVNVISNESIRIEEIKALSQKNILSMNIR